MVLIASLVTENAALRWKSGKNQCKWRPKLITSTESATPKIYWIKRNKRVSEMKGMWNKTQINPEKEIFMI